MVSFFIITLIFLFRMKLYWYLMALMCSTFFVLNPKNQFFLSIFIASMGL